MRAWGVLALLCVLLATAGVVGTYSVFSQTYDEPLHIASGMEWIQNRSYMLNTENPPLARIAIGLGPFVAGARLPPMSEWDPRTLNSPTAVQVGDRVLYRDSQYIKNLTQARLGTIPFLWLLAWIVWRWSAGAPGDYDPLRGTIAVAATMTLPSILAHSGLATTDIAFVALFVGALFASRQAIERRTNSAVALFGVSLALTILSKFSTLLFFPAACVAFAAAYALERGAGRSWGELRQMSPRNVVGVSALVAIVAGVTVWAGYGFSFGRMADLPHRLGYGGTLERGGVLRWWATTRIPAPELWHGLLALLAHVRGGQPTYLLGRTGQFGFWDYYPVALAVKTPLAFLLFCGVGITWALVHMRRSGAWSYVGAALAAVAIIAACLNSPLNYGSRHVLVVYPLLAIAAAWGWRELTRLPSRGRVAGVAVVGLLAWQTAVAVRAYPDFLPYFNELARDPGAILIDSDLDWGQDYLRLADFTRSHEIHQLHIAYFGTVMQCRHDAGELLALEPGTPTPGWVAISESYARASTRIGLRSHPCDERATAPPATPLNAFAWLGAYEPAFRIGRSIRLYRIPPY